MDSLYFNKIAAGVLIALITAFLSSHIGHMLVKPEMLKENAYPIDIPEGTASSTVQDEEKLEPVSPLLAAADLESGKKVSKKCVQCHTFESGGAHKIGPNLWNIVGSKPGTKAGFAYSAAIQKLVGTWDYEALNSYLYKPKKHAPGTKMAFAGLAKPQDRANIIAYIRTQSDAPAPLPAG